VLCCPAHTGHYAYRRVWIEPWPVGFPVFPRKFPLGGGPIENRQSSIENPERGGMGEWLKPAVLKTVSPEKGSGVRIPLPPPEALSSWTCLIVRSSRSMIRSGKASCARS
jgi:hypothetical protein